MQTPSNARAPGSGARIRVMVVDDSSVMRGAIARIIGEDTATMEVVATEANGQLAVERARKGGIDVVILDIEMPVMDGLTALPLLLAVQPRPVVIMASTLTTRNAEISLKALGLGAKDYVPKPSAVTPGGGLEEFKRELLEKVRTLGARYRPLAPGAARAPLAATPAAGKLTLRPRSLGRIEALAIGSSTGGPTALVQVLKSIPAPARVPIFITQHMPATFTRMMAENLTRETKHSCAEAVNGEAILAGKVYVAPGDFHMTAERQGGRLVVMLNQRERENFCRPAVDPMLRSLTAIYQRGLMTVMLTGMGQDGLLGSKDAVAAGGSILAQDEQSSVVWGMPGAVAKAGLCYAVKPLDQIGAEVTRQLGDKWT